MNRRPGTIPLSLALRLREAGLRWEPVSGDRFAIPFRDMDDDVFVIADMLADVYDFPHGRRVIGFNGTVEWALDSVEAHSAVWLPAEHQLREALGGAFRRLERDTTGWTVHLSAPGVPEQVLANSPVEAYGEALLLLMAATAD